ncbi:DUF1127 domain-containing protein [Aurantimonas sp. A2-1-M11]|uniref:DUF1127 domain-containing protein n=1 Tax=Aurantimonas sp. A2-1-M11 TaxID=3113712 RepID=UPI002F9387D1
MAITTKTRLSPTLAHPTQTAKLLLVAGRAIVKTMLNRRKVRAMSEMSDYMLKDIGLRRDDIYDALRADWREDPSWRLAVKAAQRRRGGYDWE